MKNLFLALILFLLIAPAPALANNYSVVLLGKGLTQSQAVQLAKSASAKLESSLAYESLKTSPKQPKYLGPVSQVFQDQGNTFSVAAFLRDNPQEAEAALKTIQKKFPQAQLKTVLISDPHQLDGSYQQTFYKRVLILGSSKDYASALKRANSLSQMTGLPFSKRGMVLDPKKGLIWPANFSDEILAGSYLARRDNFNPDSKKPGYLSVERSDFYSGFTPGLYLVVGGIYDPEQGELQQQLDQLKTHVPDAYAKLTPVYMGCVH